MMEFEDPEEEEVEDEELEEEEEQVRPTSYESSMPNSSSRPFVMSNQTPIHRGAGGGGSTAAAAQNETRSSSPPPFPLSLSIPPGKKPPARYRECLKNHAVGIGGHAVDGCGEFMPAGPEGSLDALKCAACSCHRNFHRKEVDLIAAQNHCYHQVQPPIAYYPHPHPISQFYPYNRASAGEIQHGPLALPSTSGGGGEVDEAEMISDPMSTMGLGSSGKKRFRTRFTPEQKEKMRDLAEKMGWRMQKQDEAAVQHFCEETGVRRHVLKVWMHNNKHTLGKKP